MRKYTSFTDIQHVIEYLKTNTYIWYQAPMDSAPVRAEVVQYTVTNRDITRSRMTLYTSATKAFSFRISEHFDRFRLPEIGRVP